MKKAAGLFVAILLSAWWVVADFRARNQPRVDDGYVDVEPGDILCRPDRKPWASNISNALIIVGSATCSACLDSRPFEQELDDYGKAHGVPVFFVLSSDTKSDELARELAGQGKRVLRAVLREFGVNRIPAFIRVDSNGRIESKWTDTVPDGLRESVFFGVVSGHLQDFERVPQSELPSYLSDARYQILALSPIGQQPAGRAIVIPANELAVRARYELNQKMDTVIDCGSTLYPYQCQAAAMVLTQMHFTRVITVGLPVRLTRPCL